MSSEDPKQVDAEPRSSKKVAPSVGDADVREQPIVRELPPVTATGAPLKESEIDAAIRVLGQPSQSGGSSPASMRTVQPLDASLPSPDPASPLMSASSVEKSKREASASSSGEVAGDSDEVTTYFDRGDLTSRAAHANERTDGRTAPNSVGAEIKLLDRAATELEKPPLAGERYPQNTASKDAAASEEPTLFFRRPTAEVAPPPVPGSQRSGQRRLPPIQAPPFKAAPGPLFSDDRASSISLGSGIAGLASEGSAPFADPQLDRSSSQPPSTKSALPRPLPPRPDAPRAAAVVTSSVQNDSVATSDVSASSSRGFAEPNTKPSQRQPTISTEQAKSEQAKSEQVKAEQVKAEQTKAEQTKAEQTKAEQTKAEQTKAEQAGAGEGSADAEPLSERSNDAPGGDVEVPAQGQTAVTAFSIALRPGSAGYDDEAWLDPITVRGAHRLIGATACCAVAGLAAALVEALYAHRAAMNDVSLWQLTLGCAGLLVPLCLAIGAMVAVLSILLHPDAAPSLGQLKQKLRPTDIRRQARLAVILGVAPIAGAVWILAVARASLPLLGSTASPPVIGTLLAAVALGLGLLAAVPVLALARYAGVRLRQRPPDPVRWGAIGMAMGLVLILLAVATGPTSGAGSGLAILGVFKRPELDLRAPCLLLLIALAGYLVPSRIGSLQPKWLLLVAMLPLGLTYRAAARGLDVRKVALAVERGAPLSRTVLSAARRLTDGDHDGFSRFFGGGDCDDRDRNRNPGQEDVPQNGIDEDCSGKDSAAPTARNVAATPSEELRTRRTDIPSDLNLILFIVDTLRADTLRQSKRVTPRFDELATQSTVVEQAYAPASYTGKSVGPILIGKHSSETNRDFGHFSAFSKRDTFVQQRLQRAGIRTLSVQGYWYFYQPLYGFDRGFDVVDSDASSGTGYVEGDRSSTGAKLTERILAQLDKPENTNGRFFLWSQYTDPHAEYVAHSGFDFGSDALGRYLGEVAFVDHQIGRIIDFVRSKPWGARTAIVITSDHGESFGEHGMIRHGFELWEPLIRVPLIISVPGVKPRQIGTRRNLVDLVPTILDLMRLDPPADIGTDFVSGHSLLPEMLGIQGSDAPRPLLVDMAQGPFTNERQAYIDGDLKLLTAQGRPLGLFDLSKDTEERHDLLDETDIRERVVTNYRAFKKTLRIVDVRGK